ncbi:c6 transcription factor [Trichoderma arundinaceum]|uniref:C6 transcription factor n=1 Tax=Trichoderma arundinaceum TaxID=490622 RepID=A0A395P176_TRIAR|nr:c6 transcription factor [Trichoderma arundinaceum]
MAKRSCDFCVQRKTRCDNGRPCRKCLDAQPPLECTYLKPVLKRGPKTSKLTQRCNWKWRVEAQKPPPASHNHAKSNSTAVAATNVSDYFKTERLPLSIFKPIIEAYSSRMYPVWPVLHVPDLLTRLEELETSDLPDADIYTMTLALCSATMAQLNLTAIEDIPPYINSEYMEKECNRLRILTNYREHPSVEGALTSFFLHVYHAKADNRNASMVFLQEGISIARLLRLDRIELESHRLAPDLTNDQPPVTAHKRLVYILLWVSERGYAIQHDLPISILDTVQIPSTNMDAFDKYGKGLVELATLFAAFDAFFYRTARYMYETSQTHSEQYRLITVQRSLENIAPKATEYDLVQRADYNITRHWMRILIWQQAMSRSLLSSCAEDTSMTFLFPSQIAQDFLTSITINSKEHLVSLGRDQLIKSFEITNTLADVILCTTGALNSPHAPESNNSRRTSYFATHRECWKCGPADFLHAMYQTISPFLAYDKRLNDMIRLKAADALLCIPSRIIPRGVDEGSQEQETQAEAEGEEDSNKILEQIFGFTTELETWNADLDGLALRPDGLDEVEKLLSSDTL